MARLARAGEARFAQQLRQVGTTIGHFVRGIFDPNNPDNPGWQAIEVALDQYKEMLRPWADQVARRVLADINRRDTNSWHQLGLEVGRALKQEVESTDIRHAMNLLYDRQVGLIVGLPDKASERLRKSREFSADIVTQLRGSTEEAMLASRRWTTLVKEVRDTGLDVQSDAATVARTETARAHTTLQAARAQHIGSEIFQWVTANDFDVRPLHRALALRNVGYGPGIYRWDAPPLLDDNQPGLPGTIYNCRCHATPILPALPA